MLHFFTLCNKFFEWFTQKILHKTALIQEHQFRYHELNNKYVYLFTSFFVIFKKPLIAFKTSTIFSLIFCFLCFRSVGQLDHNPHVSTTNKVRCFFSFKRIMRCLLACCCSSGVDEIIGIKLASILVLLSLANLKMFTRYCLASKEKIMLSFFRNTLYCNICT